MYRTFVENKEDKKYPDPTKLPETINFKNLLNPLQDYFEIGIKCKLENANELIFPANCSFYITNDEKYNMYYKIYVDDKPLTKQNLAYHILDWLIARNAYFSIKTSKSKKQDIHAISHWRYANHLAVHDIHKMKETRHGLPIYNMKITS